MIPVDQRVREEVLDENRSFLLQAPAGSGKTELLVQRTLRLLATAVEDPEELIAITFTRKAAAEMRERILSALHTANDVSPPSAPAKRLTWELAQAVRATDIRRGWGLIQNPNRLRILTIDALSAMLSAQMPLLSGFGAKPQLCEQPQRYYRQSVVETLLKPYDQLPAVNTLLLHFENDAEKLTQLLCQLLAKREQWLIHLIPYRQQPDALKAYLEQSLARAIETTLQQATEQLPDACHTELVAAASFAASQLHGSDPTHPICACKNLLSLPDTDAEQLPIWLGLANLLLNQQGQWRKRLDKNLGFPAELKAEKARAQALIEALSGQEPLRLALVDVQQLPPSHYAPSQWQVIDALLSLLPRLTAELALQFQQHGVIDFVELSLGALRSLNDQGNPTELALYLDYQIRHLLVDEFQDTSVIQYALLTQLTREWQPQDGKTLFLVGDPMQSIYRFRNAEVSLFLQTQQQGLNGLALECRQLTQNFRSAASIINWVNTTFASLLPATPDLSLGAVSYSASQPSREDQPGCGVFYYAAAAEQLVPVIMRYQTEYPNDSIAVLVRSRSHLPALIQQLETQGLRYEAVELDPLQQRPEIRDLLSLTQALLHPADRIAWLSVLRAPWCGLNLSDLHQLATTAGTKPLLASLAAPETWTALSLDGQQRLNHAVPTLLLALEQQGRQPLARWIKQTWLALKGDVGLEANALANTHSYFELLTELEAEFSLSVLAERINTLFAKPPTQGGATLNIMTIHKAKGLEFDHVLIPELHRSTPPDSAALLLWEEAANNEGETDLILAPLHANTEADDPIHAYLRRRQQQKLAYETARLLYVATTRAKKSLHLAAQLPLDNETGKVLEPNKGSFLRLLWPSAQSAFIQAHASTATAPASNQPAVTTSCLRRLCPASLTAPTPTELPRHYFRLQPRLAELSTQSWHTSFGTILHEVIAQLTQQPSLDPKSIQHYAARRCAQCRFTDAETSQALSLLDRAIHTLRTDEIGRWILQQSNAATSEYALITPSEHGFQRHVLDRSFCDETETVWVIDYKSARPGDEPMAEFLAQQKSLHQAQLARYAALMQQRYPERVVKVALYFPLCAGFIAWEAAGALV